MIRKIKGSQRKNFVAQRIQKRMHFYIKKGKENILSDWSVEIFVCCRKVVMLGDRHYNKDESETGPARARAHWRKPHYTFRDLLLFIYLHLFTIPYCVCVSNHLSIIIMLIDYKKS